MKHYGKNSKLGYGQSRKANPKAGSRVSKASSHVKRGSGVGTKRMGKYPDFSVPGDNKARGKPAS